MNIKRYNPILAIFLLNLLFRLLLLNWYPATYTDSILYMNALNRIGGTIILPAYPAAIVLLKQIFADPVIAGRLASILAASLAVFPLFGLTRTIYDRRSGLIAVLLYTVSPLIVRWSLRIFPHSLYSLFVLLFLYGIFKYQESRRMPVLAAGVFCGGLAVLTYPTGLVLFPVALAALAGFLVDEVLREKQARRWLILFPVGLAGLVAASFLNESLADLLRSGLERLASLFPLKLEAESRFNQLLFLAGVWFLLSLAVVYRPGKGGVRRPLTLIALELSFSSFIFLHVWQKYLARSSWYQQGMMTSYRSLAGRWESWLTHYLFSYPYILFYPVAAAAVIGLVMTVIRKGRFFRSWAWLAFFFYFAAGIFYALVVNKWWTPRYQYTLAVITLVPAGFGLSRLLAVKKPRWLGPAAVALCLGGSLIFTLLVLYWSRESFADISRSALHLRDHYENKRVFSDEIQKVGFWAKRPLRGYTRRSSSTLNGGDILVLHGWHTNIQTEYRYLNRLYRMKILEKFPVDIVPLLADDIVDWAGKRLRRRANAPVVWDERFRPQHFESWIIEILARRDGKEIAELDLSEPEPAPPGTEYADYFDVGVWEVKRAIPAGAEVVLEMAHARGGDQGAFRMEVFSDSDVDGVPDTRTARSPVLKKEEPGEWSRWTFSAPGGRIFVGSSWELGSWVYYSQPPWPGSLNLGEIMYYSRGGIPTHTAHRVGRIKITFPGDKELD